MAVARRVLETIKAEGVAEDVSLEDVARLYMFMRTAQSVLKVTGEAVREIDGSLLELGSIAEDGKYASAALASQPVGPGGDLRPHRGVLMRTATDQEER